MLIAPNRRPGVSGRNTARDTVPEPVVPWTSTLPTRLVAGHGLRVGLAELERRAYFFSAWPGRTAEDLRVGYEILALCALSTEFTASHRDALLQIGRPEA